jgi:hypothetical protein
VLITVNKSTQQLSVAVDGEPRYVWPTSTARRGYSTPNGSYRPERLERKWYSRKYDWSPMPYSIFFDGGYAIHGSYEISHLGRPASHGCIRLYPRHAAVLFALVQRNRGDTRIVVTGERPSPQSKRHYRVPPPVYSERPVRNHRVRTRHALGIFEEIFDEPPVRYSRDVYYSARLVSLAARGRSAWGWARPAFTDAIVKQPSAIDRIFFTAPGAPVSHFSILPNGREWSAGRRQSAAPLGAPFVKRTQSAQA